MYVSPWLQAALIPDEWRVAGVSCRALSVWHVFVLASWGNPYIVDDPARMDRNAAAELLLYASRSHAAGKLLYSMPRHRAKALKAMHATLGRQHWADINAACLFYVASCRRAPEHKEPVTDGKTASAGRKASAPLGWILVDFLAAGNPDQIEAAWDTPHAVACCLFDARRNINGQDDTLVSIEEEIRWASYQEPEAQS